jgi:hypothetical protein
MPVFETYASRVAAAAKASTPEIYTYDRLPRLLRRQLHKIFAECIGPGNLDYRLRSRDANEIWDAIAAMMDRETDSFSLLTTGTYGYGRCGDYLERC